MARQRRPKFIRPPGFKFLTPGAIPLDLAARGWKADGDKCASRGRGWPDDAFVETDYDQNADGDRVLAWVGYSAAPQRKLRGRFHSPVSVMRAVENGEACGPLADCWEGQDGPPQRVGWTYMVRQKRDGWGHYVPGGVLLCVLQAPPLRAWNENLRYVAFIDGRLSTNPADGSHFFQGPVAAMQFLEATGGSMDLELHIDLMLASLSERK